jgi:hypothetical protein
MISAPLENSPKVKSMIVIVPNQLDYNLFSRVDAKEEREQRQPIQTLL